MLTTSRCPTGSSTHAVEPHKRNSASGKLIIRTRRPTYDLIPNVCAMPIVFKTRSTWFAHKPCVCTTHHTVLHEPAEPSLFSSRNHARIFLSVDMRIMTALSYQKATQYPYQRVVAPLQGHASLLYDRPRWTFNHEPLRMDQRIIP